MPKIQFATDVSNWGLLRWPAKSRGLLVTCVCVSTALTFALGFWAADYILNLSSSVLLNLLIITANLALVILSAYLQAVLVGDLSFKGAWRERVILGKSVEELGIDASTLEDRNLEFVILLILLIIANTAAVNFAAGGFLDQYHRDGFYQVQLRSPDASERVEALQRLAEPIRYTIWEEPGIQQAVIDRLNDSDQAVRKRAIVNVRIMDIAQARSALVEILRHDDNPELKEQAAITLGQLGEDSQARALVEDILVQTTEPTLQIAMLQSLGFMRSIFSVPVIAQFVEKTHDEVVAYAYWALSKIEHADARQVVHQALTKELTPFQRCAALEAFKALASTDDTMWARREFQRVPRDERCTGLIWEDLDGKRHYIIWDEAVRLKLLKIVANTNPFEHRDWIQRLVNDPAEDWHMREVADEIIVQMNRIEKSSGTRR